MSEFYETEMNEVQDDDDNGKQKDRFKPIKQRFIKKKDVSAKDKIWASIAS